MTMTYDGTMVMPKNFAVVTEDEMTYVDGGAYNSTLYLYDSGAQLYNDMNQFSSWLAVVSVFCIVGGVSVGLALGSGGGPIGLGAGALVGAVAGLIGGSIVWGWKAAADVAAMDAMAISGPCFLKMEMNNLTIRFTVKGIL